MSTFFVHLHLGALVEIELVPDHGLVAGREPCPGLVGAPVIVLHLGDLNVVVESYDPLVPQLLDGGPVAQLSHEHFFRLLDLLLELLLAQRVQYVALFELARRRPQRQLPVKLHLDFFTLYLALLVAVYGYDMLVDQLVQLGTILQEPLQIQIKQILFLFIISIK